MFAQISPLDQIGEFNPQLFREIKGRINLRNVVITATLSIVGQVLLWLSFKGKLPLIEGVNNRYCTGEAYENSYYVPSCIADLNGNVMIIKELWWLDVFTTMSVIGIFILLVAGSYMLVTDIAKEENKGTFNFIRLSPQSATNIFLGKILGVPILIYLFGFLAIPLHLWAGLSAKISFPLIIGFYLVLATACAFFYSVSSVLSLTTGGWGSFQAPVIGTFILFFLLSIMGITLQVNAPVYTETSFDWFLLFYPGTFLAYAVESTFLASQTVGSLNADALMNLRWYGAGLWHHAFSGGVFMMVNYLVWTFWLWQGLKRRFHNPLATIISKKQSYGISATFAIINVGFALQNVSEYHTFFHSLITVQGFNLILFLLLIPCLMPSRQALVDWARFRHQNSGENRHLFKDLGLGEKSPPLLAIIINLAIVNLYLLPSVFTFGDDIFSILFGLVAGIMVILFYASLAQTMMLLKTDKRALLATGAVMLMMATPVVGIVLWRDISWLRESFVFLSGLPIVVTPAMSTSLMMMTLLGETLGIVAVNLQTVKTLNKAGMSVTKRLMMAETE
ncbi:MAG: ABC transporter permease [Cyanobacterium sp. T60_A2020_053]|nr:ABC transporter permease [Cyanobacterium sp. T60_A2020_053]